MKHKLSNQQRVFVAEYMKDRNATAAAERAGYGGDPNFKGPQLLRFPPVKAEIERRMKKLEDRLGFQAEDVLRELWKVGSSDIRKAFDEHGRLRPIHEIPEEFAKAIAGIDEDELFEGVGQDRVQVGVTKKVRLHPKVESLIALGKYFKLFTEKHEHGLEPGLVEQMEMFKQIMGSDIR